jgi:hypothetical protein
LAEGTVLPQCEILIFYEILHNFTLKMAWNIIDLAHLARIVIVKVAGYCEHSKKFDFRKVWRIFEYLWKYQLDKEASLPQSYLVS